MHINRKIERFLIQFNMPATTFGRAVARDPRLVLDMRRGREPRAAMIARAETFMAKHAAMVTAMMEAAA